MNYGEDLAVCKKKKTCQTLMNLLVNLKGDDISWYSSCPQTPGLVFPFPVPLSHM